MMTKSWLAVKFHGDGTDLHDVNDDVNDDNHDDDNDMLSVEDDG